MLLQNGQQMFSTIDLCMVDLYNAGCDLIKSGAASTFIMQGNEIEVIHGDSFPTGIMQQADYESRHRQLSSGSTIVMMTDGVMEALPAEDGERLMAELIGKTASQNAREHAKRLMERVYLMEKLHARDDMTILVGTLWKKE
jgi:stage II sporulation protein E